MAVYGAGLAVLGGFQLLAGPIGGEDSPQSVLASEKETDDDDRSGSPWQLTFEPPVELPVERLPFKLTLEAAWTIVLGLVTVLATCAVLCIARRFCCCGRRLPGGTLSRPAVAPAEQQQKAAKGHLLTPEIGFVAYFAWVGNLGCIWFGVGDRFSGDSLVIERLPPWLPQETVWAALAVACLAAEALLLTMVGRCLLRRCRSKQAAQKHDTRGSPALQSQLQPPVQPHLPQERQKFEAAAAACSKALGSTDSPPPPLPPPLTEIDRKSVV